MPCSKASDCPLFIEFINIIDPSDLFNLAIRLFCVLLPPLDCAPNITYPSSVSITLFPRLYLPLIYKSVSCFQIRFPKESVFITSILPES